MDAPLRRERGTREQGFEMIAVFRSKFPDLIEASDRGDANTFYRLLSVYLPRVGSREPGFGAPFLALASAITDAVDEESCPMSKTDVEGALIEHLPSILGSLAQLRRSIDAGPADLPMWQVEEAKMAMLFLSSLIHCSSFFAMSEAIGPLVAALRSAGAAAWSVSSLQDLSPGDARICDDAHCYGCTDACDRDMISAGAACVFVNLLAQAPARLLKVALISVFKASPTSPNQWDGLRFGLSSPRFIAALRGVPGHCSIPELLRSRAPEVRGYVVTALQEASPASCAAGCGKPALFVCSGCSLERYCCRACQRRAWRAGHKDTH